MDTTVTFAKEYKRWLALPLSINLIFHPILSSKLKVSSDSGQLNISFGNEPCWFCSCIPILSFLMWPRQHKLNCTPTRFVCGVNDGPKAVFQSKMNQDGDENPNFPPLDKAIVKAVACELVHTTELPLSRLSTADVTARAVDALKKPISSSTVWRILDADAIKPWQYKYWIFPRDPHFAEKAGVVLDLYAGFWQDELLGDQDYIISADEKTSIQARLRCHPSLGPARGSPMRVENEYERGGALQYLAAWDVRRGYVMGRCEAKTGIVPFGKLVKQVMAQEPYCHANRVFWVTDNGSSHRGQASINRLAQAYPNVILVHTPVHASWLNQVEIYFSIVQRKVLTPNDFASLKEVEQRLLLYEELSNQQPHPFKWKFDRATLEEWLKRLEARQATIQRLECEGLPKTNQGEKLVA